jgi:hypothetical protein
LLLLMDYSQPDVVFHEHFGDCSTRVCVMVFPRELL